VNLADMSRESRVKASSADERADETERIVQEYMRDFVVRPALNCGRGENVLRAWREAASSGR